MNLLRAKNVTQQATFEAQIEAHRGILVKVVSAFAWRTEDQQDLAQEISVQLWIAYPKYDTRRVFSTWMYQVALNTAISWSRKSKLRERHHASSDDLVNISTSINETDESVVLFQLLDTLDGVNRALIMLYLDELSYAEIGEILGISTANVATKISRLKTQLRIEATRQSKE